MPFPVYIAAADDGHLMHYIPGNDEDLVGGKAHIQVAAVYASLQRLQEIVRPNVDAFAAGSISAPRLERSVQ